MARTKLSDVLGALSGAARDALRLRNPHLDAELRMAMREAESPVVVSTRLDGRTVVVEIDGLKLESEANLREQWKASAKRSRRQRRTVLGALASVVRPAATRWYVSIERVGVRHLDSDNLVGSAKHVRDAVAEWLGVGDAIQDPVSWSVTQSTAKTYACRIRIEPA